MNKRQIAFSAAAILSAALAVASAALCLATLPRSPRPVGAKDYLLLGAVFVIAVGLLFLVAVSHKDSPLYHLVAGTGFERFMHTMSASYGPARQNGKAKLFVRRERQPDPRGRRLTESALAMLAIALIAMLVEANLFFGPFEKGRGTDLLFTVLPLLLIVPIFLIEALIFLDNKKGAKMR